MNRITNLIGEFCLAAAIFTSAFAVAETPLNPTHFIGTGPYKVTNWVSKQKITLEKNEHYWQQDIPKLDRLILKNVSDDTTRLLQLDQGIIDLADDTKPAKISGKQDLEMIQTKANLAIGYLYFNNIAAPFDDPQKRFNKAISLAFNRLAYHQLVMSGEGVIANRFAPLGFLPPKKKIENEFLTPLSPEEKMKKFKAHYHNEEGGDLAKAKELILSYLEENNLKEYELELWIRSNHSPSYAPRIKDLATQIKQAIEGLEVGVTVIIKAFTPDQLHLMLSNRELKKPRMAIYGWSPDIPNASDYLKLFSTTGRPNWSHYYNPEFDRLLKKAVESNDMDDFRAAHALLERDMPAIPLAEVPVYYAVRKNKVKNLMVSGLNGAVDFSLADVEVGERGRKTVIFGVKSEARRLDPLMVEDMASISTIGNFCEGLVRFSPQDPFKILPGVAESYEFENETSTFAFTIRKDLKYSDGNSVRAEDVLLNFTRIQAAKSNKTSLFYAPEAFPGSFNEVFKKFWVGSDDRFYITINKKIPKTIALYNLGLYTRCIVSPRNLYPIMHKKKSITFAPEIPKLQLTYPAGNYNLNALSIHKSSGEAGVTLKYNVSGWLSYDIEYTNISYQFLVEKGVTSLLAKKKLTLSELKKIFNDVVLPLAENKGLKKDIFKKIK